jgi:hypothetical protein
MDVTRFGRLMVAQVEMPLQGEGEDSHDHQPNKV